MVAALIVAAWLIPALCMALGVGWLLPLLIWTATASLIRCGRNILDRLVLALGLLVGLTCAVGLVLSLWPVTLRPVPSSGLALTGLVLAAVLAGRRPEFPTAGLGWPAVAIIGGTLACAGFAVRPFLGQDFAGRLSILANGGDLARHFTIYDTIRSVGGFLFMHREVPMPNIDAGYESYPQGSHFIYALLANVMPQGADRGDAVASFGLLITLDIGTFVVLCLATLWATRWVAGPLLGDWVALPFLAAICGYLCFGDPITLLTRGFPSEMAGWAMLAILVAVVVRPVARVREQIVLVAALVVAISFTYFLFLPFALTAALVWMIGARRQLSQRWIIAGSVVLVAIALAAVSPVVNTVLSPASVGDRLLLPGEISKVSRQLVVFWLLIAIAAPVLRWQRRSPIWRTVVVLLMLTTLPAAAMFGYQVLTGRAQQTYYVDKLFHEMLIVTVVCSGSILLILRPAARAFAARRLITVAYAWMLSIALVVSVSNLAFDAPAGSGRLHFQQRNAIWEAGKGTAKTIRLYPKADGRLTWVQLGTRADLGQREASHWATLYTAVLQRNYRASWSLFYWGYPWLATSDAEMAEFMLTSPMPYRVLVDDTMSLEMFRRIQTEYPALDLEIVDLRGRS
ncbi:hypothetical protein [Dactylosporangium sp. NPDC051484]|uniref:hypothetical protein n=1 Tax=Dactylosporangium sp. NPDC051484 TaxID=3154942 RepID=UPI00344D278E